MSETERLGGNETLLALLYAAGELDENATLAFERRLADEQAIRDALCSAVRLGQTIAGQPVPTPDPAYREQVRSRLRKPNLWQRIVGRNMYRGHPSLWAFAGAIAAAIVLMSGIGQTPSLPVDEHPASPPAFAEQTPAPPPPAQQSIQKEDNEEEPALMSGRHLACALNEENWRKSRAEDRRLVRIEDQAARLRTTPIYRP